jgi:hypothetical protein
VKSAGVIFIASFAVVFAMAMQQLNVTAGRRGLAFATSLFIGVATLVQFKLLPGPTTWIDIGGYLFGGAAGVVSCMWLYPRLLKLQPADGAAPNTLGSVKLGETLRLALCIADDSARADIECECDQVRLDGVTWYDTRDAGKGDALAGEIVDNAVRFLHLRGRLVKHPTDGHLVRHRG